MGTKYTAQSATGYNTSPPSDDGTANAANQLNWSKHISKIGDPIKNLTDAVNTALVNHFDVDTIAKSATYATTADDDRRTVECTSSPTITLGAAASMGTGYVVTIKCVSGTTTVATSDTIDGSASNRTLAAGESETYVVNQAASAYLIQQLKGITKDETATLTNKTLTSPVINVTSDAEGDIYYRDSGGAFTRLAPGTAGQVLQTNGAAAAPSWGGGASASYLGEITGGTTGQELGELTGIATTTKVITLLFSGVSVDTNAKGIQIEIGDSSGYAAVSEGAAGVIVGGIYYSNGYTGGKAYVRGPQGGLATSTFYGTITLTKRDSANVWMVSGNVGSGTVSSIAWTGGYIDNAAGVVDRIKITCESAANFDGGSVQVFERT